MNPTASFSAVGLFALFLIFSIFKFLYLQEGGGPEPLVIPTFEIPSLSFIDLSGGCGGFTDCLEYIGAVIYNIGLGIIFLVLFIIEFISYAFELISLLVQLQFTGIEGVPAWLNIIIVGLPLLALGLILYKSIRKGSTNA